MAYTWDTLVQSAYDPFHTFLSTLQGMYICTCMHCTMSMSVQRGGIGLKTNFFLVFYSMVIEWREREHEDISNEFLEDPKEMESL